MKRSVVIPLILAALSWTCGEDTTLTLPPDPGAIVPLAATNYWVYNRTIVDSAGHSVGTTPLLVTVASPVTAGGAQAFPVSNFPFRFLPGDPLLFAASPPGFLLFVPAPPEPAGFVTVLKHPTASGDRVTVGPYTILTGPGAETVTAAAGGFTCTRYTVFEGDLLVAVIRAAPRVGIVTCWQLGLAGTQVTDELRSYYLRP
jgi:hypothetical protein